MTPMTGLRMHLRGRHGWALCGTPVIAARRVSDPKLVDCRRCRRMMRKIGWVPIADVEPEEDA